MKQLLTIFLLCGLFLSPILASAQSNEYVRAENERLGKANATETEIAKFISKNLKEYRLSEALSNEVLEKMRFENNGKPVAQSQAQDRLLEVKESELRKLYFKKHPEKKEYYKPVQLPTTLRQTCDNGDFESGATSYSFASTSGVDIEECTTAATSFVDFPVTAATNNFTTSSFATLVDDGASGYIVNDPSMSARGVNITTLSPNGSHKGIKLNNGSGGQGVTTMRKSMAIGTTDTTLEYEFSLMLQASGHLATQEEPIFRVRVLDSNNNVVAERCIIAAPSCVFQVSHVAGQDTDLDVYFTGWLCDRLDVSSVAGENVTVEFTITDCGGGGHYGMVYIDNVCGFACENPAFGFVSLKPINDCPDISGGNINVCGNFIPPVGTVVDSYQISISDGGPYTALSSPSQFTVTPSGNDFCFHVDTSVFGTSPGGTYQFMVTINYTQTCLLGTFPFSNSALVAVSFEDCCQPTLTSTGTLTGTVFEQRSDWIKSADIFNGSTTKGVYHAGKFVELNPGFVTNNNAKFAAYIDGCSYSYTYRPGNNQVNHDNELASQEINLIKLDDKIIISPNPSSTSVTIASESKITNILILSMDGKIVFSKNTDASSCDIDVSSFEKAVYIITVETANGKTIKSKFIKN